MATKTKIDFSTVVQLGIEGLLFAGLVVGVLSLVLLIMTCYLLVEGSRPVIQAAAIVLLMGGLLRWLIKNLK